MAASSHADPFWFSPFGSFPTSPALLPAPQPSSDPHPFTSDNPVGDYICGGVGNLQSGDATAALTFALFDTPEGSGGAALDTFGSVLREGLLGDIGSEPFPAFETTATPTHQSLTTASTNKEASRGCRQSSSSAPTSSSASCSSAAGSVGQKHGWGAGTKNGSKSAILAGRPPSLPSQRGGTSSDGRFSLYHSSSTPSVGAASHAAFAPSSSSLAPIPLICTPPPLIGAPILCSPPLGFPGPASTQSSTPMHTRNHHNDLKANVRPSMPVSLTPQQQHHRKKRKRRHSPPCSQAPPEQRMLNGAGEPGHASASPVSRDVHAESVPALPPSSTPVGSPTVTSGRPLIAAAPPSPLILQSPLGSVQGEANSARILTEAWTPLDGDNKHVSTEASSLPLYSARSTPASQSSFSITDRVAQPPRDASQLGSQFSSDIRSSLPTPGPQLPSHLKEETKTLAPPLTPTPPSATGHSPVPLSNSYYLLLPPPPAGSGSSGTSDSESHRSHSNVCDDSSHLKKSFVPQRHQAVTPSSVTPAAPPSNRPTAAAAIPRQARPSVPAIVSSSPPPGAPCVPSTSASRSICQSRPATSATSDSQTLQPASHVSDLSVARPSLTSLGPPCQRPSASTTTSLHGENSSENSGRHGEEGARQEEGGELDGVTVEALASDLITVFDDIFAAEHNLRANQLTVLISELLTSKADRLSAPSGPEGSPIDGLLPSPDPTTAHIHASLLRRMLSSALAVYAVSWDGLKKTQTEVLKSSTTGDCDDKEQQRGNNGLDCSAVTRLLVRLTNAFCTTLDFFISDWLFQLELQARQMLTIPDSKRKPYIELLASRLRPEMLSKRKQRVATIEVLFKKQASCLFRSSPNRNVTPAAGSGTTFTEDRGLVIPRGMNGSSVITESKSAESLHTSPTSGAERAVLDHMLNMLSTSRDDSDS